MRGQYILTVLLFTITRIITGIGGENCRVFSEGTSIIQNCISGCCENRCCAEQQISEAIVGVVVGCAFVVLFVIIIVICCTRKRCQNRRCCHANSNAAIAVEREGQQVDKHPLPGPFFVTEPPRKTSKSTDVSAKPRVQNTSVSPDKGVRRKTMFSIWKW